MTLNRWFLIASVGAWTLGLVSGALAVREGYSAQRLFSQSVNLRRLLIQDALMQGSVLEDALKRQGSKPSRRKRKNTAEAETPEAVKDKAKKRQKYWQVLFILAVVLFVIGVVLAGLALIMPETK